MHIIERVSKSNAQEYFSMITSRAKETAEEFRHKVADAGGPSLDVLDYSPESLVPLWAWLYPQMEEADDKDIDVSQAPPWYLVEIRNNPHGSPSLTQESLWWLDGLAFYFAEVMLKNLPNSKWTTCNDDKAYYAYKYRPVIAGGGRGMFNPVHNMLVACLQAIHRQPVNCDERLLNIFKMVKAEGKGSS